MAVVQHTKSKVHPVTDYRKFNEHVDADIYTPRLRKWLQQGVNVTLLDLFRAYLQVQVHESLWTYQTVLIKEERYYLMRFGFRLNVQCWHKRNRR